MKKLLSAAVCFIVLITSSFPSMAEETVLEISAPSVILIEASTGQVLYEKNSHDRRPPASVTKIMTALLALEAIDNGEISMDDMVRCSENAASMGGTQVYLEPNEEMSVYDMLKAIMVASANDAAAALGEFVAGSSEGFVSMMNERAKELGMNDTTFINCNGLDAEGHLTSAFDIALMSKELISHQKIFDFTTIWMDSLRDGKFGLVNTNKLIRFYEGATGIKTGSTDEAKYCLSASAKRNGMDLIAVVLGAPSSKERFADASKLLDYGFANYAVANSLISEEDLGKIKLLKGIKSELELTTPGGYNVLVGKSKVNDIEKRVTLPDAIQAPIASGEKVGEISFYIDGQQIGGTDIIAKENAPRANPLHMLAKLARQLCYGTIEVN